MRNVVQVLTIVASANLLVSVPLCAAQLSVEDARADYGRSDIPLVSAVRIGSSGAYKPLASGSENPVKFPIVYLPDRMAESSGDLKSYSDTLHFFFARSARNSGLPPVSATMSDRQTEALLWCKGTSRDDYLYGSRAAHVVVDRKKVSISATARDSLDAGDPVNYEAASTQTTISADKARLDPALWASFFDAKPAVYDMTVPVSYKECVVEAYQGQKYVFLWRADYHDDAAAKIIDQLWNLVNRALPAEAVIRFFPSPVFFPNDDLRTTTGTHRLAESEKIAWHNQWDALFTRALIEADEVPLYGTEPRAPVFRLLTSAYQGTFGAEVFTMTFDNDGDASVRFKSYEYKRCGQSENSLGVAHVDREFSAPADLARRVYDLLTSDAFRDAAGDEQTFGADGAEYLFEFLQPDGTYIARKRWSPQDGIFEKIAKLTNKVTGGPAAKAESAVVSRKWLHHCPGRPAPQP